MKSLEKRVAAIEERNKRVEQDKAWETSLARRLTVTALTYIVVAIYLNAINNNAPFANALVPALGYLLSTLVLTKIRDLWQK